ncbi:MAG: hypothetical protein F6K65_12735 [Moorea sp. SIO3C2]|nr:hypothetical protein [Moorena sp. SIO3C2]
MRFTDYIHMDIGHHQTPPDTTRSRVMVLGYEYNFREKRSGNPDYYWIPANRVSLNQQAAITFFDTSA